MTEPGAESGRIPDNGRIPANGGAGWEVRVVELTFSDEAVALARNRGGLMALDFIAPIG